MNYVHNEKKNGKIVIRMFVVTLVLLIIHYSPIQCTFWCIIIYKLPKMWHQASTQLYRCDRLLFISPKNNIRTCCLINLCRFSPVPWFFNNNNNY